MIQPEDIWDDEWVDWFRLTPQERWRRQDEMWEIFLSLCGSMDDEPDPQSPFYPAFAGSPAPAQGRPGVRVIRRGGV